VAFNLMMTMLLGGLWHGAALNFVFWGAYHGLLLVFARSTPRGEGGVSLATRFRRRAVCFHLVLFGWLLFRVTSFGNMTDYLAGFARLDLGTRLSPVFYAILGLGFVTHYVPADAVDAVGRRVQRLPAVIQGGLYAAAIFVFSAVTIEAPSFIYFQF